MKFTKSNLKKLETIFDELSYEIIYEKGNFNSGYCIVEGENIIVINKFFDTEMRINCLLNLYDKVERHDELLSDQSQKYLKSISKYDADSIPSS